MKTDTQRIKELVDRITRVSDKIDKKIKELSITTEVSGKYFNALRIELKKDYAELKVISKDWFNSNLVVKYSEEVRNAFNDIKTRTILPELRKDAYKVFMNKDSTTQGLMNLLNDSNYAMYSGLLQGENTLNRLTRLTQQINIAEKQIIKNIVDGFIEKGTALGSKKRLQNELLKKAIDGKYIMIVNKHGKQVQYNVSKYAELVARTKLQEATTQATVNVLQSLGGDLVQISAHNSMCEVCMDYEGKVFSISGNDPDFPPAEDLSPFHPFCKHNTLPIFKEALEASGKLDDYIAFSNGEIDRPPNRSDSFIPIAERQAKLDEENFVE